MQGQVIFSDEYDLLQDDITVEKSQHKTKKRVSHKKGLQNPYIMNRHQVRPRHFRDARLYNPDINEPGWEIQRRPARLRYRRWVESVRKNPGWEGFNRRPCSIKQEIEEVDSEGNTYTMFVWKIIPMSQLTDEEVHRRFNGGIVVRTLPVINTEKDTVVPRKE